MADISPTDQEKAWGNKDVFLQNDVENIIHESCEQQIIFKEDKKEYNSDIYNKKKAV